MSTNTATAVPVAEAIAVRGWAHLRERRARPAVIVNPEADTLELLHWAKAQIWQANVMLEILGCASIDSAQINEAAGVIRYFTEQAQVVLQAACDRRDK